MIRRKMLTRKTRSKLIRIENENRIDNFKKDDDKKDHEVRNNKGLKYKDKKDKM